MYMQRESGQPLDQVVQKGGRPVPLIRNRPHGSTSESRPCASPYGVTRVTVEPEVCASSGGVGRDPAVPVEAPVDRLEVPAQAHRHGRLVDLRGSVVLLAGVVLGVRHPFLPFFTSRSRPWVSMRTPFSRAIPSNAFQTKELR